MNRYGRNASAASSVEEGFYRWAKRLSRGPGIEQRPTEAESREIFGHWEMDLIVGPLHGSKAALLTLIGRKYRHIITRKIADKTQASVLNALKGIERQYGVYRFRLKFKTIMVDKGSEFLDFESLETFELSKRQRTRIFYAHP
ncbi:MAG: IS30 family transposase [Kiritimatiellae bacterium]|nr:IS30 family transposase [Kiritimatiellia bacterium]